MLRALATGSVPVFTNFTFIRNWKVFKQLILGAVFHLVARVNLKLTFVSIGLGVDSRLAFVVVAGSRGARGEGGGERCGAASRRHYRAAAGPPPLAARRPPNRLRRPP